MLTSFWHIGFTADEGLIYRTQLLTDNCKYLKPSKNKIKNYETSLEGMRQFYNDHNIIEVKHERIKINAYKMRSPPFTITFEEISKYINEDTKYILDANLLGCWTSLHCLINSNAYVISTDSLYFEYNWYGKMFIDSKFPGRHLLISNNLYDSKQNKLLEMLHPDLKLDLIYLRLTKNEEKVYSDIMMYRKFAHENTHIILESVCPHQGWGIGQYIAMNKLIQEGVLLFVKHVPTDFNYIWSGLAVLKYNFDPTYIQKLELKDYIEMEINVPLIEFTEFVVRDANNNIGEVNEYLIQTYKDKFAKFGLEFDDYLKKILKEKFNLTY